MAQPAETLREKASRLLNEYDALADESAYSEAEQAYQQLLTEHPEDARLHVEYGLLQQFRGQRSMRAAAACFERAIELGPDEDQPHYQLIFVRAALHQSDRLIDLYKKRLAAAPDQIREYRFLARAYLATGALEETRKVITAGRKLGPDDDGLLSTEADLLEAEGRREESLAVRHALKARDPGNLSPYYMNAFTLEALGRYEEAATEWRYIIGWLEAHDMALHTAWPKEMLQGMEAKIRAAAGDPRTTKDG
jgi:tetratricopeptide (TPR) repeat protein